MKDKEIFPQKYRVRKSLYDASILQTLIKIEDSDKCVWVDVPYNEAPRALRSEIIE